MKRIVFLLFSVIFCLSIFAKPEIKKLDSIVKKEIKIIKNDADISVKDSILYQKLSAQQLIDLKREENMLEVQRIEAANRNDMPLNGFGIVMICLMPFVFIILLFLIISKAKNRETERKFELFHKSLEMGQAIPEHLFDSPKVEKSSNFKKGIIWLAVGVSLVLYFVIINENEPLILGILPSFVGLGYLLVHFIEKTKVEQ